MNSERLPPWKSWYVAHLDRWNMPHHRDLRRRWIVWWPGPFSQVSKRNAPTFSLWFFAYICLIVTYNQTTQHNIPQKHKACISDLTNPNLTEKKNKTVRFNGWIFHGNPTPFAPLVLLYPSKWQSTCLAEFVGPTSSSWWFQPLWKIGKILVKLDQFPR